MDRTKSLKEQLKRRILVLDGAMGTMVQTLGLDEQTVRGERFADHPTQLKNFIDLLCLTRPEAIVDIHRQYLQAGADIIETNTFNSNAPSMADYGMEELVYEINLESAKLARQAADEFSTDDKPRFVAGVLGPTSRTCSISPDVNDPGYRKLAPRDFERGTEDEGGSSGGGSGSPAGGERRSTRYRTVTPARSAAPPVLSSSLYRLAWPWSRRVSVIQCQKVSPSRSYRSFSIWSGTGWMNSLRSMSGKRWWR